MSSASTLTSQDEIKLDKIEEKEASIPIELTNWETIKKNFYIYIWILKDFVLIFADWFGDIYTVGHLLVKGYYGAAFLTLVFPFLSGIICLYRLPGLKKKHGDPYFFVPEGAHGKVWQFLSKIPSFQPSAFNYLLFITHKEMYPVCDTKLVDFVSLEKITVSLSILEGIFEATPQTVLQTYVYVLDFEIDIWILVKIGISIYSMSRAFVTLWMINYPFVISQNCKDHKIPEESALQGLITTVLFYCKFLPFYCEVLPLIGLRILTITYHIPHLSLIIHTLRLYSSFNKIHLDPFNSSNNLRIIPISQAMESKTNFPNEKIQNFFPTLLGNEDSPRS